MTLGMGCGSSLHKDSFTNYTLQKKASWKLANHIKDPFSRQEKFEAVDYKRATSRLSTPRIEKEEIVRQKQKRERREKELGRLEEAIKQEQKKLEELKTRTAEAQKWTKDHEGHRENKKGQVVKDFQRLTESRQSPVVGSSSKRSEQLNKALFEEALKLAEDKFQSIENNLKYILKLKEDQPLTSSLRIELQEALRRGTAARDIFSELKFHLKLQIKSSTDVAEQTSEQSLQNLSRKFAKLQLSADEKLTWVKVMKEHVDVTWNLVLFRPSLRLIGLEGRGWPGLAAEDGRVLVPPLPYSQTEHPSFTTQPLPTIKGSNNVDGSSLSSSMTGAGSNASITPSNDPLSLITKYVVDLDRKLWEQRLKLQEIKTERAAADKALNDLIRRRVRHGSGFVEITDPFHMEVVVRGFQDLGVAYRLDAVDELCALREAEEFKNRSPKAAKEKLLRKKKSVEDELTELCMPCEWYMCLYNLQLEKLNKIFDSVAKMLQLSATELSKNMQREIKFALKKSAVAESEKFLKTKVDEVLGPSRSLFKNKDIRKFLIAASLNSWVVVLHDPRLYPETFLEEVEPDAHNVFADCAPGKKRIQFYMWPVLRNHQKVVLHKGTVYTSLYSASSHRSDQSTSVDKEFFTTKHNFSECQQEIAQTVARRISTVDVEVKGVANFKKRTIDKTPEVSSQSIEPSFKKLKITDQEESQELSSSRIKEAKAENYSEKARREREARKEKKELEIREKQERNALKKVETKAAQRKEEALQRNTQQVQRTKRRKHKLNF